MTGPTAHAPPAPGSDSTAPAALGVLPGALPPPARPLGSKGSFLKPPPAAAGRPQECALGPPASPPDATCACATLGSALRAVALLTARPPSRLPRRLAPLWLRVRLLSHPKEAPSSPVHPLLAKGPARPPPLETSTGCPFPPALPLPPSTHFCVFQLRLWRRVSGVKQKTNQT